MAIVDADRLGLGDEPSTGQSTSRARRSSLDRHSGELVEIKGGDEDFFGQTWQNRAGEDEGDSTEQEDEEEMEDFSGHSVHTEGVPSCEVKLKAKSAPLSCQREFVG